MKKLAIVVGSLIFLLLAAILILPFVIDVDKYRPQILKVANEKINGKLDMGKLSLSLWGQIRVQVAGLTLEDSQGTKVVSVKDAYFHVPFTSIFSGAPLLTFKMQEPSINVVKFKNGKMNVMTLMKPTDPATAAKEGANAPGTPTQPAPGAGADQPVTLPSMVTRARLGVEIRDALVNYRDLNTDLSTQVKDLNVILRDISLSRPTELEIWATLDTKMGKTMTLKGPARVEGKAMPEISGGKLQQATLSLKANMDDVEISMPGLFEKKKGVEANLEGSFKSTPEQAVIEKLGIKFHNARIAITGSVSNLATKDGAPPPVPVMRVTVKSNDIDLKPWNELIPMLKAYELAGSATLDAQAQGPTDKLDYQADLAVKGLRAKAPHLKAQPQFDATVHVITDQIKNFSLTMKAPANDLRMNGSLVSFTQPKLTMDVTSSGMDLDQLIDFPPPASADAKKGESANSGASGGGKDSQTASSSGGKDSAAPAQDMDALLDPLRTNPMAAAASARISVNMKMLKAYNIKMTDITARMTYADLTAAIEQFSLGLWSGTISANMNVAMKPKTPTYRFGGKVAALDLKQAVVSQMALLKNTVTGKATFEMNGEGASFNPDPAKKNLKARGGMRIESAKFSTLDIGAMASEAITKALERIGDKIPAAKGKNVKAPGRESRYDLISANFTISDGKFHMPDFVAKAEKNQGIDVKGNTTLGLIDYSLNARWELIDTYNFTQARDISVEHSGIRVEHILAEGNDPVKFPVTITGTAMAPQKSYTEVPEYLTKVALNNVGRALEGKARAEADKLKAEARKQVEEKAQEALKNAPPKVQEAAKDLRKKLFGR